MNNNNNNRDNPNHTLDDLQHSFTKGINHVGTWARKKGKQIGKKALSSISKMVKRLVGSSIKSLIAFVGSHLLLFGVIILASIGSVILFSSMGDWVNQQEYQTKFTTNNYQEDTTKQNNSLKTGNNGYLALNKNGTSNGNKMYYVYYAMNAPRSHWYYITDNNDNIVKKARLSTGKLVNGKVRGDSPEASEIEEAYSNDNNGSSLFHYAERLSLSTDLLYLLDNTMNHDEMGAGRKGFYFTEQFVRPVSTDKHANYKSLDSRVKLTTEEKAVYAAKEKQYQEWLKAHPDSSKNGGNANSGETNTSDDTSSSGTGSAAKVMDYAKLWVTNKIPYVWGGSSGPDAGSGGADCSGFVMRVYQHFGIKSMPHNTNTQVAYILSHGGKKMPLRDAKAGDLYYWETGGNVHHVAIALGDGSFYAEPEPGKDAEHESLATAKSGGFSPSFAMELPAMRKITGGGTYSGGSDSSSTSSSVQGIMHNFSYVQRSLDTGNLVALSNQFDVEYNPKREKDVNGKNIVVSQTGKDNHAYVYSNGKVVKTKGVWNYGFGAVIKLRQITYRRYKKITKTSGKKTTTTWKRYPDKKKIVLAGLSVPVGTININKDINDQLKELNAIADAGKYSELNPLDGYYTTMPNLTNSVNAKNARMYGLDYFYDYLGNYTTFYPSYVKANMNLTDRWKALREGADSSNKSKKAMYKQIMAIADKEKAAEQSATGGSSSSSGSSKAQFYKGSHGGIKFIGSGAVQIQRTMKYWSLITKYAKMFDIDPYMMVAEAAEESGGEPGIAQGGAGGPGWGFFQFEFNGDGFGNSRKVQGYLANGKSITLTLSKGDNIQKQIKAGAAFMSEARSWVSSTKGNVAAMVIHHHKPTLGQQMAEKGHLSLGKSLGTGIDNAYLKRWLAFYGGKDPWVESVHGKVRVYGGGNTTGATGVTVANSGSDSGGQDFFSWILSTFKKVAVSLFGESSLDAQGVDIWSTTKVPEYPKQPKNEWQPAVDHYSWDSRTLHLKNEQVLDLGREWMMDLMTQNGQTTYFDDTPDNSYIVGRWLDDYVVTQFLEAQQDGSDNSTSSNNSNNDDAAKDFGSPLKGVSVKDLQVNSAMGWRNTGDINWHQGYDFQAAEGTPVTAVAKGEIVKTGYFPDQGNLVLEYFKASNVAVFYQHLSSINCKKGDEVEKGQVIGHSGHTGGDFAPHLHLSEFKNASKYLKQSSYPMPSLPTSTSTAEKTDYVSPGYSFGLNGSQVNYVQKETNRYSTSATKPSSVPGGNTPVTIGDALKHK